MDCAIVLKARKREGVGATATGPERIALVELERRRRGWSDRTRNRPAITHRARTATNPNPVFLIIVRDRLLSRETRAEHVRACEAPAGRSLWSIAIWRAS